MQISRNLSVLSRAGYLFHYPTKFDTLREENMRKEMSAVIGSSRDKSFEERVAESVRLFQDDPDRLNVLYDIDFEGALLDEEYREAQLEAWAALRNTVWIV